MSDDAASDDAASGDAVSGDAALDDAGPGDAAPCARSILSRLGRQAYRRPLETPEIDRLLAFYEEGSREGGFESGIELALRFLLASPQFIFRLETEPEDVAAGAVYAVSDLDLASRLSYFLWSSIPDDELLSVAERGELSAPDELRRQVRRMLADPRASALVENFAGQWLYLRNLANTNPDPPTFPDFDDNLRRALQRETELFFESVMAEDRSVLDLLTADYTFLNERLARHYGIPGIYGDRFRRVAVTDDARRGILGHGSLLTVTSYATRTSPVLRGKWILENLLGSPPPPPPPDVPDLEDAGSAEGLSIRERLEQHRANPACAACHARMDPYGFGLENFDAIGRWRGGQRWRADRRLRRAARRHGVQRAERASGGHPAAARLVPGDVRAEAADLRRGPRHGVLRRAGRPPRRAGGGTGGLPFLGDRRRRRDERRVPDEDEAAGRGRAGRGCGSRAVSVPVTPGR